MKAKKITNAKLSTNKACPKPFRNMIKDAMNELADVEFSRPATILYKKLPDNMILITGFENFLTIGGIQEKYGWDIISVYSGYPDYMMLGTDCIHIIKDHSASIIPLNKIYNKKDFSNIIAHVKKCGSLLHDIIAAVNDGQEKRITI